MDGFTGSTDDSASGASACDVTDRLLALELRVQQQEDELTVMKAALADVLRRLATAEESAAARKTLGGKGGAGLREAYSMSCISNGGTSGRKRDSASLTRKDTLASAAKSGADKKELMAQHMEEIQEREEAPPLKDTAPPPQRSATPSDNRGHAPKRGPSVKRFSGGDRAQSGPESTEEQKNKLRALSRPQSKTGRTADRQKDAVASPAAKMSTREKNSQADPGA